MPIKKLDLKKIKDAREKAAKEKGDKNREVAQQSQQVPHVTNSKSKAFHMQKAAVRATADYNENTAIKTLLHCPVPVHGDDDMGGELAYANIKTLQQQRIVDEELALDLIELKKYCAFTQMQAQVLSMKGKFNGIENVPFFQKFFKGWLTQKGFDSSTFATWIPQLNTAFFFEEIRTDPMLDSKFRTYNMRTKTERVNHLLGKLEGRLQGETDTFAVQSQTSDYIDFSAQDNVVHTEVYNNIMEDADPNAFNNRMQAIVEGLAIAREKALIYGDDTITTSVQGDGHMDSDIAGGAATLFTKAWKGLRKLALANSANGVALDFGGGSIDKSAFQDLIRAMPIHTRNKLECLWLLSLDSKTKIDTGAITELTNVDYANSKLLETGERTGLFGIPFYASQYQREDLGASGVYAATSTKTTLMLVNHTRFFMGVRSPIRLWAQPSLPNIDKIMMTGKERISFSGAKQSAVEKSVGISYNIESL